ncbi:MAG: hypothetical protein ACPHCN_06525 [Mycobacterium sp.]
MAADIDTGPSVYRDRCVIAGVVVQGRVDVMVDTTRRVERSSPKGGGGARMVDNGYLGADVSIEILVWTEDQRDAFYTELLPKISPRTPDGPKTPVSIDHWKTSHHGVENIYVQTVSDGKEQGGKQSFKLKAPEWLPGPKPVTKAPGTAAPAEEEVGIYDEDDPTHRFPADVAGEGIDPGDVVPTDEFWEE